MSCNIQTSVCIHRDRSLHTDDLCRDTSPHTPKYCACVIAHAQQAMDFCFSLVQTDNGTEFSRYFEQLLQKQHISVRHTRLGRPNDNAHIERFNRTIQEECLGSRISSKVATATLQVRINQYIEYYNTQRVHLGLQLRTPASMLQRS